MEIHGIKRWAVMAAFLGGMYCVAANAQAATDYPPAPGAEVSKVNVEEIFGVVGKMDMGRQMMFMWWPDEVWASLAFGDKTPDAILGYTLINLMNQNYLLFSPIAAGGGELPPLVGKATLTNDAGLSVQSVDVSESFYSMIPGLQAFPVVDAAGKSVISKDTKSITVSFNFQDDPEQAKYTWDLPLQFPGFVSEAYAWIDERMKMDPALLPQEEMIFRQLRDVFKIDMKSGLMVAPISTDLFKTIMAADPEMAGNALALKMAEAMIKDYSFYIVLAMDIAQNPARVRGLVENAVIVNAKGETLKRDLEAEKSLADAAGNGSEYLFLVYPKVDDKAGYQMNLTNPVSGEKSELSWKKK